MDGRGLAKGRVGGHFIGHPAGAQLEEEGVYHGYPMPEADLLRDDILARWQPAS
jgi:hypothetical protein